ncbi:DUF4402 domain-containing protein [Parasphingorhabdus halotolerans]|uniref:DUF4402 domain-containing protein n=1 Tax=Parasphingorhabdus halotolerans TaxID=2725558 RepID=A0A6H2DMX0_9SPHN|nr:DUF4402 domain-containing protein [Parasphingorhabdus halotolerans]QJB69101.1 DUF4402 domain-containing protein [Parasphingorhabdus halotolerans]
MINKPFLARVASLPVALFTVFTMQSALAAPADGDSQAEVRTPITVVKNSDLAFGNFLAGTTNSEFRINAVSGVMSKLSGDAVSIGGTISRASFTATGTPGQQANIRRSQNSINIVRVGGTETMRVNDFFLGNAGGLRDQILDAAGQATYFVGGRLRIGPNQVPGNYRGTFSVTIDYP